MVLRRVKPTNCRHLNPLTRYPGSRYVRGTYDHVQRPSPLADRADRAAPAKAGRAWQTAVGAAPCRCSSGKGDTNFDARMQKASPFTLLWRQECKARPRNAQSGSRKKGHPKARATVCLCSSQGHFRRDCLVLLKGQERRGGWLLASA